MPERPSTEGRATFFPGPEKPGGLGNRGGRNADLPAGVLDEPKRGGPERFVGFHLQRLLSFLLLCLSFFYKSCSRFFSFA